MRIDFLFYFLINYLVVLAYNLTNVEKSRHEFIICRKCGADVADSHYLFEVPSPGTQQISRQNLFGKHNVTVKTLINPFGIKFDIITIQKARCQNIGLRQGADSWFPDYSWRICACPQCGQHIGWTFDKSSNTESVSNSSDTFHGLILNNILGENFTDSLIMMPKIYM